LIKTSHLNLRYLSNHFKYLCFSNLEWNSITCKFVAINSHVDTIFWLMESIQHLGKWQIMATFHFWNYDIYTMLL